MYITAASAEPGADFGESRCCRLIDVGTPFGFGVGHVAVAGVADVQEPVAVLVGELIGVLGVDGLLAFEGGGVDCEGPGVGVEVGEVGGCGPLPFAEGVGVGAGFEGVMVVVESFGGDGGAVGAGEGGIEGGGEDWVVIFWVCGEGEFVDAVVGDVVFVGCDVHGWLFLGCGGFWVP